MFVVVLILVTTKVKWINQSTYKISDFNRHHDSTAHEDDLSELAPQVPLKIVLFTAQLPTSVLLLFKAAVTITIKMRRRIAHQGRLAKMV